MTNGLYHDYGNIYACPFFIHDHSMSILKCWVFVNGDAAPFSTLMLSWCCGSALPRTTTQRQVITTIRIGSEKGNWKPTQYSIKNWVLYLKSNEYYRNHHSLILACAWVLPGQCWHMLLTDFNSPKDHHHHIVGRCLSVGSLLSLFGEDQFLHIKCFRRSFLLFRLEQVQYHCWRQDFAPELSKSASNNGIKLERTRR
jgi:hypothetical protein